MSVLDKLSLENHNLLIDADLYLFQATVASEETICWDEDGDIWSLRADLKQAKKSFTERLESFKRRLDGGEVLLCFTTGSNFRKTVYEPYKSNRKKTRKPVGYVHMVGWAMEQWPSITVDTLEADDIMGILQSAPGYETVVVSDDKDLLGIPGTVYRPMKDEIIDVSLPEADAWFLKQCLMGDSTDLDVTQAELLRHIGGELAHKIWPQMSPPDREFLISGVTPQEWDEAFRCEGCEE